jgi:hypothetical protein
MAGSPILSETKETGSSSSGPQSLESLISKQRGCKGAFVSVQTSQKPAAPRTRIPVIAVTAIQDMSTAFHHRRPEQVAKMALTI